MPGISTSRAESKTREIMSEIEQRVAQAMPKLAIALQQHIAEKEPTPEQEYLAIMVGDGGGEYTPPPLNGYQSGDDPSTGRVRFMKEPGTFLKEMAIRPENVQVTADSVSVGNRQFLIDNARFFFKDFIPKRPRPGAVYPTSFFSSASYFEAFEYGTADGAGWTGDVAADGTWRLRPDDVERAWTDLPRTMFKPIYARLAYYAGDLDTISREFLDGILASR